MPYLYETHMHTCQASRCGVSTGEEQARFYKDAGYKGIIMTDHFTGGNTAVPRDLPWRERIDWFCSGYEDALITGQKIGLDVFFAWEQNYEGDEYLVYGPDKVWLLENPDIEFWSRARQLEEIHRAGGAVIQAHPFRDRSYISRVLLGPEYCDGIEAANTGNRRCNDICAAHYALRCGLFATAGSDNHNSRKADSSKLMGVAFEEPLRDMKDYAARILRRERLELRLPVGCFDRQPEEDPQAEAFWIDEDAGQGRYKRAGDFYEGESGEPLRKALLLKSSGGRQS